MGRLFDEYLISILKDRIPMPKNWQGTMGLELENSTQSAVSGTVSEKLSGYSFQKDEPLQRGFISRRILSQDFNDREKYMMQIYLQAILEHRGEDYTKYFNFSTTNRQTNGKYETTIPVIGGEAYTAIGRSLYPATWKYYSEITNEVFAEGDWESFSERRVIDTKEYKDEAAVVAAASQQEYFMIKVISEIPVIILRGKFKDVSIVNQFEDLKKAVGYGREKYSEFLPSIMNGKLYSNKLIPALLGITINENSNKEVKDAIISHIEGDTLEEGIIIASYSVYDRDGNLGGNLQW